MSASAWQQVLALDARYNAYRAPNNPQFRTLYIRRRSQLLREKSKQEVDASVLKDYMRIRSAVLSQRYGIPILSDQSSLRSRGASNKSASRGTIENMDEMLNRLRPDLSRRSDSNLLTLVPTSIADASRAMAGDRTISENYSFSGMHHIFDQHMDAVTSVKFAHDDKSRLACCSYDGKISICQVIPTPATVICILEGHTSGVTDFVWSLSNDSILSCSLDGTSRLWQVSSGSCLRVIPNPTGAEVLCCLFQPLNNNLFVTGDSKRTLQTMNLSTGKGVRGGMFGLLGRILSLAFDTSGKLLWTGDDKGFITSFLFDIASGKITKAKRIPICEGHPVTCISARAWLNREARDPSLLVNCGANAVCLYRIIGEDGSLQLKRKFPIKQRSLCVRSTFCPLMSFRPGACIVSGSEDMCIYFFDVEKENKPCINTLQGHSAPVLDVSFAHDESMLASCDMQGIVIVWKREQKRDLLSVI